MMSREETLRRLKAVRHSSASDRVHAQALSMTEIARSTGIPRQYLHEIAAGKSPLGAKTHPLLSDFFDCQLDCQENGRERADPCSIPTASFGTGSGSVYTVKWPDFGPETPRKRGMR